MRRSLLAAPLLVTAILCTLLFVTTGAGAEPPATDGWWSVTNSGGLMTPPPPGVPPGGLYIANGLTGPSAIAALTFAVAPGLQAHRVLLHVAGTPLVTAPPVACPATGPYQPAMNGPWAKRPAYDCRAAQVTGQPDATRSSFGFAVGGLERNGYVAVVILAGGTADSVAFSPPGSDSLDVAPAAISPGGEAHPPAQAAVPAPVAMAAPPLPSELNPAVGGPVPAVPALAAPVALPPPPAPAVAAAPPRAVPGRSLLRRAGSHGNAVPGRWAKSLALAALIGFLGVYALGYGILGGRIGRVGLAVDDD